jgi:hypothetical protein
MWRPYGSFVAECIRRAVWYRPLQICQRLEAVIGTAGPGPAVPNICQTAFGHSRTSTKCPAMAAAAAISGETR